MLGAMVVPVANAVQTLGLGWKEAGVIAVWRINWTAVGAVGTAIGAIAAVIAAIGAVFAAKFAALAFRREGALLRTAQEQVEATREPVVVLQRVDEIGFTQKRLPFQPRLVLKNIGNGAALKVLFKCKDFCDVPVGALGAQDYRGMKEHEDALLEEKREFILTFWSASGQLYEGSGFTNGGVITSEAQRAVNDKHEIEKANKMWLAAVATAPMLGGLPRQSAAAPSEP